MTYQWDTGDMEMKTTSETPTPSGPVKRRCLKCHKDVASAFLCNNTEICINCIHTCIRCPGCSQQTFYASSDSDTAAWLCGNNHCRTETPLKIARKQSTYTCFQCERIIYRGILFRGYIFCTEACADKIWPPTESSLPPEVPPPFQKVKK